MSESRYRASTDPNFRIAYPERRESRPSKKYYDLIIVNRQRIVPAAIAPERSIVVQLPAQPIVPVQPKNKYKLNLISFPKQPMFYLGLLVFFVGVAASVFSIQQTHVTTVQAKKVFSSASANTNPDTQPPAEDPPKKTAAPYKVAPTLPATLGISKIGVNANIKPLSVNSKNQLQAPNNIYDVGWYNASAKPGDSGSNGAILLDGHVHGPTLPGVFAKLSKLQTGDIITLSRGDGKKFSYKVAKVQNVDVDKFDMGDALSSAQPGLAGLNIVTCGGQYDKSGHYNQRTIVYSVLN